MLPIGLSTNAALIVAVVCEIALAPNESVTVNLTVYVPAAAYVYVGFGTAAGDVEPSPNVHENVMRVAIRIAAAAVELNRHADIAGVGPASIGRGRRLTSITLIDTVAGALVPMAVAGRECETIRDRNNFPPVCS